MTKEEWQKLHGFDDQTMDLIDHLKSESKLSKDDLPNPFSNVNPAPPKVSEVRNCSFDEYWKSRKKIKKIG